MLPYVTSLVSPRVCECQGGSNRSDEDKPRCYYQPAPIVDYAWYPSAAADNPATFCFLASVRECPVRLLDASDGRVSLLLCITRFWGAPGAVCTHASFFVAQSVIFDRRS